jgi:hypothetical protein
MTLRTAIQAIGIDKTAEELLAALVAVTDTTVNSDPQTWTGLSEKLLTFGVPPEALDDFVVQLPEIPGGKMMAKALDSGGVDFSLPAVRAGIEANAEKLGPLADVLLSIGIQKTYRFQQFGLAAMPTPDEITAEQKRLDPASNTLRKVMLSFHLTPQPDESSRPLLQLIVTPGAVIDGEVQYLAGQPTTKDAADDTREGQLLGAIQEIVAAYLK